MNRLPKTEQTEVLVVRVSPKLKEKLFLLSKRSSKYGGNASSTIRYLIEQAAKQ